MASWRRGRLLRTTAAGAFAVGAGLAALAGVAATEDAAPRAAPAGPTPQEAPAGPAPREAPAGPTGFFASDSIWNTPLGDDVPIARSDLAERLARQAAYSDVSTPVRGFYGAGYQVNVNEEQFSVPVWTVPADQPRVPVRLLDERGAPRPPGWAQGLPERLADVPLPTDVDQLQADGSDAHLVVWQPSTDTMWEFWVFARDAREPATFTAAYGARLDGVSRASGVLPNQWGARATSLALAGGLVRMADYEAGRIPHALALAVPVIADGHLPPATRDDGPGASVAAGPAQQDAVPEGAHFRLPAGYDCAGRAEGAPLLVRLLCEAARDYGMYVVDRTGGTVSFYAEDDRTAGTPYGPASSPWDGVVFGGPDSGLDAFPWRDLLHVTPAGG
jgi:hypothetical protein